MTAGTDVIPRARFGKDSLGLPDRQPDLPHRDLRPGSLIPRHDVTLIIIIIIISIIIMSLRWFRHVSYCLLA